MPLKTVTGRKIDDAYLKQVFSEPLVEDSLYLLSPNLHEVLQRWKNNELHKPAEIAKLKVSLIKYLNRMSSRSTPFGLAAGFGLVDWNKETDFRLAGIGEHKRYTRLDMYLLTQISTELAGRSTLRARLKFWPNTSIYEHLGSLRFIERRYKGNNMNYEISEIASNEYVEKILNEAEQGQSLEALANGIVDEDIPFEDAYDFVEELVNTQLLVSELEPNLTGKDFQDQLIETLEGVNAEAPLEEVSPILEALVKVRELFRKIDEGQLASNLEAYREAISLIEGIGFSVNPKQLVRVDLAKQTKGNQLAYKWASDLRKGLSVLNGLIDQQVLDNNIDQFKKKFRDRYGDEEVPLLVALDNESGIGYANEPYYADPAPLVDDLPVGSAAEANKSKLVPVNEPLLFLSGKLMEATRNGDYEIKLSQEDADRFPANWDNFQDSFSALGSFLSDGRIFIKTLTGHSSSIGLMGRFTPASEELAEYARSITEQEAAMRQDKILAEVVHLPQARNGNVLTRSEIRDYEMPFLSRSVKESSHQLALSDITVRVLQNGKILLWSNKHNKEVLPRIASAHNFTLNPLPVYRFMGDMQNQNTKRGLFFKWPKFNDYPFYPRLVYKNVVLGRAYWRFKTKKLQFLVTGGSLDADKLLAWRKEWRLPRRILICESDRELLVDLEDGEQHGILAEFINKKEEVELKEFLHDDEDALVKDAEGQAYTNEFLIPFLKKQVDEKPDFFGQRPEPIAEPPRQNFMLGSEWLYFKLYLGFRTSNVFITDYLSDLVERWKSNGLIKEWFFIRYQDPGYHLRLRFKVSEKKHLGRLITEFYELLEPLVDADMVRNVTSPTYEREIQRYGPENMETCESLFGIHSDMIVKFIRDAQGLPNAEQLTLYFALKATDQILTHMGFDAREKQEFADTSYQNFNREFNANRYTKKVVSHKYGFYSKFTNELLDQDWRTKKSIEGIEVIVQIIDQYDEAQKELMLHLKARRKEGSLKNNYVRLTWSIIHMFVNRLVVSKSRKHELLFYALLHKHYTKELKRKAVS